MGCVEKNTFNGVTTDIR